MLTNAELDHHATYSSQRDVEATFRAFLAPAEHAVVWIARRCWRWPTRHRLWPFERRPSCRRAARASPSTASRSS